MTAPDRAEPAGAPTAWIMFQSDGTPYLRTTSWTRDEAMQACFGAQFRERHGRRHDHWQACLDEGWTCREVSLAAPDAAGAAAGGGVAASDAFPTFDEMAEYAMGAIEGEFDGLAATKAQACEIIAYALTGIEPGYERDAVLAAIWPARSSGAGVKGQVTPAPIKPDVAEQRRAEAREYYRPDASGYSRADEEWFFDMDGKP